MKLKPPSLLLPAQVSDALAHQRGQGDALLALRLYIRRIMGRAAAAVLLDKPRSAVTDAEVASALAAVAALAEDDPKRARAERAAWRAVADNQHLRREIFPTDMCGALSAAFSALDVGASMGLATPDKNSRPATAVNRDALAKIIALEVEHHKSLLALPYDTYALTLVTGVINPETPDKTPDPSAVTLPLVPLTWKQVKDLLAAGRKLLDPQELFAIRETAYAIAAGLVTPEQAMAPEQMEMRRLFADAAWRRAFIVDNFGAVDEGVRSKPRAKKRTTRPPPGRKPSAKRAR
jgi:hypothetical protein